MVLPWLFSKTNKVFYLNTNKKIKKVKKTMTSRFSVINTNLVGINEDRVRMSRRTVHDFYKTDKLKNHNAAAPSSKTNY
jgi:hypothetical protein